MSKQQSNESPGSRPWPLYASVDSQGRVEEIDSVQGAQALRQAPALVQLAQALLCSDKDAVSCIWIAPDGAWHAVSIGRRDALARLPIAEVSVCPLAAPAGISLRELDVLTLLAAGLGNDAIAERLTRSPRTIAKHVEHLFEKLQVWTRAGLASLAVEQGWQRFPTPGGPQGLPLRTAVLEGLIGNPAQHCAKPARKLQRRPLYIGIPYSAEGRGSADSREMLNGARLAVEQINARGGVLGRELALVTAACDPSDTASMSQALEHLVGCEVDGFTSAYAQPAALLCNLLSEYGAPLLHSLTLNCAVEPVRQEPRRLGNLFQVNASDITYGVGLARFLQHIVAERLWRPANRRVVVVQPFWPGLDLGLSALEGRPGEQGWEVQVMADLPAVNVDWSQVLMRLHSQQPSVVVLASYFIEDGIAFQQAFARAPLPALVYMLYSPSVPDYGHELGALGDDVVWATSAGVYPDQMGESFRQRYRERFNQAPGLSQAGLGYDRVQMLANSWARVGNARRFSQVSEDLRQSVHRGVTGACYLGSPGQVGLSFPDDTLDLSMSHAHLVYQVQDGQQRILSPAPYALGRFRTPWWFDHC